MAEFWGLSPFCRFWLRSAGESSCAWVRRSSPPQGGPIGKPWASFSLPRLGGSSLGTARFRRCLFAEVQVPKHSLSAPLSCLCHLSVSFSCCPHGRWSSRGPPLSRLQPPFAPGLSEGAGSGQRAVAGHGPLFRSWSCGPGYCAVSRESGTRRSPLGLHRSRRAGGFWPEVSVCCPESWGPIPWVCSRG